MSFPYIQRFLKVIGTTALCAVPVAAQNSAIQLFGPVNVRLSRAGAGNGANQVIFNSTTLSLSCTESPITAVLSSSPNPSTAGSAGDVLVDNNIDISNLTTGTLPVNVCGGSTSSSAEVPTQNCFNSTYQNAASAGTLTGVDPDTLASTGGVQPIDISSFLTNGMQQIKIDLADQGGYVASSSLYLNTNCTFGGVNGPANISGNTIPPNNPAPAQLNQSFNFDSVPNQAIGFQYNLGGAQTAGTLKIDSSGVSPQVTDLGLDPFVAFPLLVSGTSFATSSCLVHSGELVNGAPACKLFTLQCTTGTGSNASGAQCPVSSLSNEVLQDVFDGPAFTLPDISTPGGPTFHQGLGFLMAAEGWQGGPCSFDPASGLQNELCPQNLLTTFTGPGVFTSSGQTTHPNSTFISIAQVPEDLTSVTLTNSTGNPATLGPGNWTNNPEPYVQLSSQPPNLARAAIPGATSFVAAPITSITYGISPGPTAPAPGTTGSSDTILGNSQACPVPTVPPVPFDPPASTFTPPLQPLGNLQDGSYLLHYYATDCAGTEELKFLQDNTGSWSTNFYTYSINIDTVPPTVSSGPTLSAAGPYYAGQVVTATYACADDRSGVVRCGSQTFAPGTLQTGTLTTAVPTSSGGSQTFTVLAVDAAGNQTSKSVTYDVNLDSQISFNLIPSTTIYPLGTGVLIHLANTHGHVPAGTVKIMEANTTLATLTLSNGGAISLAGAGLSAGKHHLYAAYSGDSFNPAGLSAPATVSVLPTPVGLSLSCSNPKIAVGTNFACAVSANSLAEPTQGSITYSLDGGAPVVLPLTSGRANISIPSPKVGSHSLVVSYPAQTNYGAANPITEKFSVIAPPAS